MHEDKIYVVAGNSADTNKYWYRVYRDIKNYGWKVFCINPKTEEVDSDRIYPDFQSLPHQGNVLILVTRPEVSALLADEAMALGYKEICFQPGAYSEEAAAKARHAGLIVHHECFMLTNSLW